MLVTALYAFPYIFVFTSDALDLVSSEMEEAANILGAGGLRTIFRVTLPLVLPAILGGAIVVFLDTVALFGTPAIIALPARIQRDDAGALAVLRVPGARRGGGGLRDPAGFHHASRMFALQRLLLGRKGYVALTGKGGGRRLHAARPVALAGAGLRAVRRGAGGGPALCRAGAGGVQQGLGAGLLVGQPHARQFQLPAVRRPIARRTIIHSFTYSAATACVAVALALVVAYIVSAGWCAAGGVLDRAVHGAAGHPGHRARRSAFYAAYAPPPVALYGTAAILVLGFTTRFLPIAYVNCLAGMRSLNPEMEEAVRILGGGRLRAVARVVVPLLKTSLVGSWLLVFIPATRELSTAIFLVGANTRVISVMMLDLSENGSFETLGGARLLPAGGDDPDRAAGLRLVGRDFMLRRS